jgi:hypothetical protein
MKMSNELMRTMNKSLEVKSLKDLVRARTSENPVLLVDTSMSMGATLHNGKTRIQGLREVVAGLMAKRPTTMIAFGYAPTSNVEQEQSHPLDPVFGKVGFVTEVPDAKGGGTPLAEGIAFARQNGFARAVIISDGMPNDRAAAMEEARQFGGQIDVIFVGNPGEPGSLFLDGLASATGGRRFEGDLADVKELTGAVIGLLNGEVLEEEDDDDDEDEDDEDEDDEE